MVHDLENESVFRTMRPTRWRKVKLKRSTALPQATAFVKPLPFLLGWCCSRGTTAKYALWKSVEVVNLRYAWGKRSHNVRHVLARAAIPHHHCYDLTGLERERDPHPGTLLLAPHERPNFIKFQVVVGLRHHESAFQVGHHRRASASELPPFSPSHWVKVLRLILNTRAMPRREARSW